MHSVSIREELDEDAAAVVAILRVAAPSMVLSPALWIHYGRALPERTRLLSLVAEAGGEVVGECYCFLDVAHDSPRAMCQVVVRPGQQRRGIGSALWEQVAAHAAEIGATRVACRFEENDAGVAFATARGFREGRAETVSALDPRTVGERPPPEVDLRPLTGVDPRHVYEVDRVASRDMPSLEPPEDVPYDEWARHVLEHPLYVPDAGFLAYVDGEPAALSMLSVDRESGRAGSMFTGTMPAFRGRGLACAVKLASVRWAAANGITRMVSVNDETNAPMLAVNRRLGYRPCSRRVEYVRELDDA